MLLSLELMVEEKTAPKITIDDMVEAAARGALRALDARGISDVKSSGFYIHWRVICGIPPFEPTQLDIPTKGSKQINSEL